jgi:hypothetical protein
LTEDFDEISSKYGIRSSILTEFDGKVEHKKIDPDY